MSPAGVERSVAKEPGGLNSVRALTTLVGLAVIIGSVVLLQVIRHYPHGAGGAPGPAVWPRILLVATIVVTVLTIIESWRSANSVVFEHGALLPIVAAIITVAYALSITSIGYFEASVIFWPLMMRILGVTSWRTLLGVTFGFNLAIYFLFDVLMGASLPTGLLADIIGWLRGSP